MTRGIVETIEERLRLQLDQAREKRKQAEAYFQAVWAEVNWAWEIASSESIFEAEESYVRPSPVPVLGIRLNGRARAYPYPSIAEGGVINDTFSSTPVLTTLDPLYAAAAAFNRMVQDRELHFHTMGERKDGLLLMNDEETGSVWLAITGRAIDGPLAGQALEEIDSELSTASDWMAIHPETEVFV